MVPYFDDLFLQCDLQVYKKSEDPHSSCYVKALLDFKAEHLNGYNFFCSNVHIRSNLKYFTKIIREELSKNIPEYDIRKLYNPKTHNGNDIKISFHKLHLVMDPEEDESINSLKASKYKNCI
ncbi:MAG: hypothetical protein R3A45_10250 [Bdellovibrionota bacterium]